MRSSGNVTLRDQITRAVMSVSTNIVEGAAHESPREFARFIRYAIASVSEVEGHVQTGSDLGMISEGRLAGTGTRTGDRCPLRVVRSVAMLGLLASLYPVHEPRPRNQKQRGKENSE